MTVSAVVRLWVRAIGLVLVLALACLLVMRIVGDRRLAAAEREFAVKAGALPPNLYASARVPEEENAAILLRAGAEAIVLYAKEVSTAGEMTTVNQAVWSEERNHLIRQLIARNRPAFELLRRTAGMTRSSFGLTDPAHLHDDLKTNLPLLKLLWAQRLLWLDAKVALREGDMVRCADDARVMSVLAVALEREAPLISELVGLAAEKILLQVMSDAVARPDLDVATLSVLASAIPEVDLRAAWRRSRAFEFRLPAVSGTSIRNPEARRNLAKTALYLAAPGYFDAPYIAWMARLMQAPDVPYGNGLAALTEQQPRGSISPLGPLFHLTQAAGRSQVILSERRLARLALALRRQALATGAYPDSLDAFAEARVADPFTAERIVYKHRPDGSAQLSVPGGAKLWEGMQGKVGFPGPFTWELPVPAPRAAGTVP